MKNLWGSLWEWGGKSATISLYTYCILYVHLNLFQTFLDCHLGWTRTVDNCCSRYTGTFLKQVCQSVYIVVFLHIRSIGRIFMWLVTWLTMWKWAFSWLLERHLENTLSLWFFLPSNSDKPWTESQAADDYWLVRRGYMSAFIHSASLLPHLPTSWTNPYNLLLTQ